MKPTADESGYSNHVLELEREVERGEVASGQKFDEVRDCCIAMLREGVTPPPALADFIADVVTDKRHRPPDA